MIKANATHAGSVRSVVALGILGWTVPLQAQTAPQVNPPSRPQVETPAPPSEVAPPASTVSVDSSAINQSGNCPLTDNPASAKLSVTIDRIAFEGPGKSAVPDELAQVLAGVQLSSQGPQSIAVVCTLRDEANAALRKAGYIASIQIPAQEIADGTLRLVVVAAKLVEIRVTGDASGFRKAVEERASALMKLDPLNRFKAERILLLANDVPGLKIQLTLKPAGRGPGEVIGELKVDAQKFLLLANMQNYGSRQLGREIASVRGEAYGLTGLDDRTFLSLSNSLQWRETHVIQGGHDMGVGSSGFRVGARASFALSNPDIRDLDLRSKSLIAGIDLSMPLVRALNHNVRASGGFELLSQRTVIRQNDVDTPFTRDKIRVLFARLDGDARILDDGGFDIWDVAGYVQIRKGINVFGASKRFGNGTQFQPSRFDGDPQATVISGEIQQSLHVTRRISLDASVFGQWANNSLLNLEEFSIGNLTYGRGYDPGSNGADRAIAFKLQPRWRIISPGELFGTNLAVELTGFGDMVKLYNLDSGTLENDRRLRSVGGGVQVSIPNRMILGVLYAKPLDYALATDTVKPPARVLVSLTVKLLPWGTR